LTLPRMFSEAHFATQDGQLTAWWLLLWAVQHSSVDSGAGTDIAVGILLGLTTATKFTGWLAWVPTIASFTAAERLAGLRRFLVIVPYALLSFYAVNPPLWHDPLNGLSDYFHRNFDRGQTWNIPILFLGKIYNTAHGLPWYNTVVWLVLVTPLPALVLGLMGMWYSLVRRTTSSVAIILHWITVMVDRALPGAPPHDGIRLVLPAFGLWCVISGIGAQRAWNAMDVTAAKAWTAVLRFAIVAALFGTAVNLGRYF